MKNVTLNFPDIFLERLKGYAKKHGMKLNAVVKKAFEHLEDHELALESVKLRGPKEEDDNEKW